MTEDLSCYQAFYHHVMCQKVQATGATIGQLQPLQGTRVLVCGCLWCVDSDTHTHTHIHRQAEKEGGRLPGTRLQVWLAPLHLDT